MRAERGVAKNCVPGTAVGCGATRWCERAGLARTHDPSCTRAAVWQHLGMRALPLLVALMMLPLTVVAAPKAKAKAKHVPGAIVIVIDKSGSMHGSKMDTVKDAIVASVKALNPEDRVAVVVFDSEAHVLVQLQRAANRTRIGAEVARLQSGGGTNIFPGLKEAFELLNQSPQARKHVVLLSDGEAPTDGIDDLVKNMRDGKMTISTVAVEGADEKLLQSISTQGGGRHYKVTDLKLLSSTFVKETQLALK